MGCDIHIFVEQKSKNGWKHIDKKRPNKYYKTDEWGSEFEIIKIYNDRNYALFAILADVRNYTEDLKPFCVAKGIPEDISEGIKEEYEKWDGHSHSWFTLQELLDHTYVDPNVKMTNLLLNKQEIPIYIQEPLINIINKLKEMKDKKLSNNNIRTVFWFDN